MNKPSRPHEGGSIDEAPSPKRRRSRAQKPRQHPSVNPPPIVSGSVSLPRDLWRHILSFLEACYKPILYVTCKGFMAVIDYGEWTPRATMNELFCLGYENLIRYCVNAWKWRIIWDDVICAAQNAQWQLFQPNTLIAALKTAGHTHCNGVVHRMVMHGRLDLAKQISGYLSYYRVEDALKGGQVEAFAEIVGPPPSPRDRREEPEPPARRRARIETEKKHVEILCKRGFFSIVDWLCSKYKYDVNLAAAIVLQYAAIFGDFYYFQKYSVIVNEAFDMSFEPWWAQRGRLDVVMWMRSRYDSQSDLQYMYLGECLQRAHDYGHLHIMRYYFEFSRIRVTVRPDGIYYPVKYSISLGFTPNIECSREVLRHYDRRDTDDGRICFLQLGNINVCDGEQLKFYDEFCETRLADVRMEGTTGVTDAIEYWCYENRSIAPHLDYVERRKCRCLEVILNLDSSPHWCATFTKVKHTTHYSATVALTSGVYCVNYINNLRVYAKEHREKLWDLFQSEKPMRKALDVIRDNCESLLVPIYEEIKKLGIPVADKVLQELADHANRLRIKSVLNPSRRAPLLLPERDSAFALNMLYTNRRGAKEKGAQALTVASAKRKRQPNT